MKIIAVLIALATLTGCTENIRTRQWGGSQTVVLPPNAKLVTATWKNADLWYLIRPMREGEVPEEYHFVESSAWGALQGEVVFKERGVKP